MSRVSSSTSTSDRRLGLRWIIEVASVVVSALMFHAVWSLLVATFLETFHRHRIVNVRNLENEGNQWEEITSTYAANVISRAKKGGHPSILFVGSSVTYGFPLHQDAIFTKLVATKFPERTVGNLSIIGVGMDALTDFATCSLNHTNMPDLLVAEIPLVNSTASIQSNTELRKRICTHTANMDVGYWGVTLSRPYGTGWIPLLWEEVVNESPGQDIKISQLPSNYFADTQHFQQIRGQYEAVLRRYLDDVSQMGSTVLVYISPIYTPGISVAGADRASVEEQIALTQAICQAHGKVTCLDSSTSGLRREHYFNLTHLNHKGHRAFSEWMAEQILAHDGQGRRH